MLRKLALEFAVLALLSSFIFAQSSSSPTLTIEAIASGELTGRVPESVQWSPDGTKITFVLRDESDHAELWAVDAATGQKSVLVSATKLASLVPAAKISDEREREWRERYGVQDYHWSPDSKDLLFDSHGQFWLYSLKTGTAVGITSSPDANSDPKFSPNGKTLAFLRKHDLWVRGVPDGDERQLTKVGDNQDLLNGEVDWLYAEELYVRSNYFWSPDSKQIAFLQMDESKVPSYPIVYYGPLHAKAVDEKYPNPGDVNPAVRLGVLDAGSAKVKWINLPDSNDAYIPRFGWLKAGVMWAEVRNRLQTKETIYFIDAKSGEAQPAITESSDAWINESEEIYWFQSGDRLLLPSWRDGSTQLYLYSWDKNNPVKSAVKLDGQVTKGDYQVGKVNYVDEQASVVYFTANPGMLDSQLMSVRLDGSEPKQVSREAGTHDATFNSTVAYVDSFSALMTPPQLALCNATGACQTFWKSKDIGSLGLKPPEILKLTAADGKTVLYGQLYMPRITKIPSGGIPLLMDPYGGPGIQHVQDAWGTDPLFDGMFFREYLARQGFATLIVDNRGMAGRGRDFTAVIKGHFGDTELADQLAALDQVEKAHPEIDPQRIGWFGLSYGGYMTLYAMTHTDRIRAGVSLAPVTNWRLYDSTYTERYMGLPKDNEQGYKLSSPTTAGANLHGRLLIEHGTSDDNVHLQNTVQMAESLVEAGKQFGVMLYPAQTHGVSGATATAHVLHLIDDYFTRELKSEPAEAK
jgi:dipeptidyl-peptidase 4